MLNEIENHTAQMKLQDIADNFEFQVALLGGPGVGKTSLLHKVVNNYMEEPDADSSMIFTVSQEIMKHTIETE